ncbi:MAG: DUF3467 domain-containing protein [Candidatus Aminicenantales bacterium]
MKRPSANKETENKPLQITRVITLPETAKGAYANLAVIRHTPREFLFDFILKIDEEAQLVSRVIMSPPHAHAFLEAFGKNLQVYDSTYEKEKKGHKTGQAAS